MLQEVKKCWRSLLHAAVSAPEGPQYMAAVAAVLEPVLHACSTTPCTDVFASPQRLPEVSFSGTHRIQSTIC